MVDEFGWANEYIYGIERDYRLAKTSKLASFMNGDGDAVIMHASGLEPFSSDSYQGILHKNKSLVNDSFDVLVSNPPYAVKGFKQTIKSGADSFSLYNKWELYPIITNLPDDLRFAGGWKYPVACF